MTAGRWRLPDLDGILVEKVLDHMAEQLRPAKGEAWDNHLVPCCQGGHDGIDNLARVCPYHHRMLIPNGKWVLTGDPNQIDGLRLVHQDDLIDARAGPAP